ncbi:hypothetical protein [Paenarthrobacter ureafaciens]|uniref:hypothetical protein n=1 Tax=Paenarthrobacter ureafaciens TaxID=37931 RepID=UPI001FB553C7|nr:hypothetical protein [Paenarthrobacter ureafaciens]UOD81509.1 hypothetical protein MQZ73_01015 [Paenarthrobacter ureafaciens]WNZ04163.1 hypothetical protein PVT25_01000 [Paenarthrobacter ureafaciens]
MKHHRSEIAKFVTLASLALSLTLTGCSSAEPEAAGNTETTGSASEERAVEPTASVPSDDAVAAITPAGNEDQDAGPVVAPVAVVPAPAPVVVPPVVVPVAPAPVAPAPAVVPPAVVPPVAVEPAAPSTPDASQSSTFTFPDGHISFDVPAGWSVKVEQDSYNELANLPGGKENALVAKIYNAIGYEVASISSGGTGGLVGGPVNRTIIDSQELTSFDSRDGASYFAFVRDEYPFPESPVRYYMGVVAGFFMTEGPDSTSVNSFLIMDNGAATAVAHVDVFVSPENAREWMETEQYTNLRSMLTSLRYAA